MSFSFNKNLYDIIDSGDSPSVDSKFGNHVTGNSSRIFVSSRKNFTNPYSDNGGVYLFRQDLDLDWDYSDYQTLAVEDGSQLGYTVSCNDEYLITSMPFFSNNKGHMLGYDISNNSSLNISLPNFAKQGNIDNSFFGYDLKINENNEIAVGAYGFSNNAGYVDIYNITGVSPPPVMESLHSLVSLSSNDRFGYSVDLDKNWAIVGSPGYNNDQGCVYIFKKVDNDWEYYQTIYASDKQEEYQFGYSVALSDGYLAVGSPYYDTDNQENNGKVYLFRYASNGWYEHKQISPVSNITENVPFYFGSSVFLDNKFLISSSNEQKFVNIFSRERNWNIYQSITSDLDKFGTSFHIKDRFLFIGSEDASQGSNEIGEVSVYEEPIISTCLAQEFDISQEYVPSKTSLYLKRVGKNLFDYWLLNPSNKTVIDATNFCEIKQKINQVILRDKQSGFTGSGYLQLLPVEYIRIINGENDSSYSEIEYPVKAYKPSRYYLWLRGLGSFDVNNSGIDNFKVDILIDGNIVYTISDILSYEQWDWVQAEFVLPDTNIHTLGIRIKEKYAAIDKIYIDTNYKQPFSEGPEYSIAPYLTSHLRVFEGEGKKYPVKQLYIYDHKNSINDIIEDDWYNFNIKVLDERYDYDIKFHWDGNYFLVLNVSGSNSSNYLIWDSQPSNEYLGNISAFKF